MQGWSFSDMMYVTKHNMANAVASVSKQLDNVTEALAVSKSRGDMKNVLRSSPNVLFP